MRVAKGKTLALAAQTITGLGGVPSGMPAGQGGLVPTNNWKYWFVFPSIGLFGLVLTGRRFLSRKA